MLDFKRAELIARWSSELTPSGRALVLACARKMAAGVEVYGHYRPTKARRWDKEVLEELLDALNYFGFLAYQGGDLDGMDWEDSQLAFEAVCSGFNKHEIGSLIEIIKGMGREGDVIQVTSSVALAVGCGADDGDPDE